MSYLLQPADKWKVKMENSEEESQPLIRLSLGICGSSNTCSKSTPDDIYCHKDKKFHGIAKFEIDHDDLHHVGSDHVVKSVGCREFPVVTITEEQLVELKRQLIIYKYLYWGLPVPVHLLLPLWKSFSPCYLGIQNKSIEYYPYLMDPEPGRCRRTDGKKWRCYQSVVPHEKYCEKHMHRGRKRSRKLVEDGTAEAQNMTRNLSVPKTDSRFEVPAIFGRRVHEPSNSDGTAPALTIVAKKIVKVEPNNEEIHNRLMKERIVAINQAPCLDFSPKSVLQYGQMSQKAETKVNPLELVRPRCSWIGGNSWQCFKDALPAHKFCADHIQSRPKKPADTPESRAANTGSSNAKSSGQEQVKTGLHLDTDLNIPLSSRLTDPRHDFRDRETRSTSSSETTLSDENAHVSDMIGNSP